MKQSQTFKDKPVQVKKRWSATEIGFLMSNILGICESSVAL